MASPPGGPGVSLTGRAQEGRAALFCSQRRGRCEALPAHFKRGRAETRGLIPLLSWGAGEAPPKGVSPGGEQEAVGPLPLHLLVCLPDGGGGHRPSICGGIRTDRQAEGSPPCGKGQQSRALRCQELGELDVKSRVDVLGGWVFPEGSAPGPALAPALPLPSLTQLPGPLVRPGEGGATLSLPRLPVRPSRGTHVSDPGPPPPSPGTGMAGWDGQKDLPGHSSHFPKFHVPGTALVSFRRHRAPGGPFMSQTAPHPWRLPLGRVPHSWIGWSP